MDDERIAVVMISAFTSVHLFDEALRRGAFRYLIKPFPRRDLAMMGSGARRPGADRPC